MGPFPFPAGSLFRETYGPDGLDLMGYGRVKQHVWLPSEEAAAQRMPSTFLCAWLWRSCLHPWPANEQLLTPTGLSSSFALWF